MGRYKKLGQNVVFITIGSFASKLLSFFMLPLYTAVLTTQEYGTADLITTTINLLMPFFTLLISESIIRFALEKDRDKSEVFVTSGVVTLVGFVVFLVCSPLLLLSSDLKDYYWYFVVYYIITAMHTNVSFFVRGIEKVLIYSMSGVFQSFMFLSMNVLFLVVLKTGVVGYLLSLILSNLFAMLFLIIGAKLWRYVKWGKFNGHLMREMLSYSVPMIPNSLSWWISNSSDKYLLTFFLGVSVTGVYSVSQRIPSMFAMIATIFMGAWQISAVEDFGSEESRKFFSSIYKNYSTFNICVVAGLIFLAKPLAWFLFAKEFFIGWTFVPVLLFAFLFHAMSGFLGSVYTAAKKTKMVFVSTVLAAASNVVMNIILIPIMGTMGAAIATWVSYFLIWLVRLVNTRKILKIEYNKSDLLSYVLIACQIAAALMDRGVYSYAASGILLLMILAVNGRQITSVLKILGAKFLRR